MRTKPKQSSTQLAETVKALLRVAVDMLAPALERIVEERVEEQLREERLLAVSALGDRAPSDRTDRFLGTFGPVAAGTRGRALIRALAALGGGASVPVIARSVPPHDNTPPAVHMRRLRAQLQYLARDEHRYVERVRHGVWQLTPRGNRIAELAEINLVISSSLPKNGHRRETIDQLD